MDKPKEFEIDNVVRIAGRDFSIYVYTIVEKFMTFDQVEIRFTNKFREKASYILDMFAKIGMLPTKDFTRNNGISFFGSTEDVITSKEDGKKFTGFVNKIVISKIPELYRYTNNYIQWEK